MFLEKGDKKGHGGNYCRLFAFGCRLFLFQHLTFLSARFRIVTESQEEGSSLFSRRPVIIMPSMQFFVMRTVLFCCFSR